jgi:hypothetical protein
MLFATSEHQWHLRVSALMLTSFASGTGQLATVRSKVIATKPADRDVAGPQGSTGRS